VAAVQLQIPPKSVYVGVARLAVAGLGRAAGFDEDAVFHLKAAVSEALSTAALDGDEDGEHPPVSLSWEEDPDSVVIEVRHAGALQEPASVDLAEAERRAMSVALLRSLLDECEFISSEDGATTIRLTLNRT
jgi:anti-sigma regulatory factor (Ser/Thr protein kinase)